MRTIDSATHVLAGLRPVLDENYITIVKYLFESDGRIVLTGIGKSAIIAQKISATLNSTGTPALFMHAADAVHGDLGMIAPNDTVLMISKSGESPEIKVLIPFVKNLGNKIIGLVSLGTSYLARNADMVLPLPVDEEADPNNLAPTTSTTAQMAMGDAIAMSLLALRGFKTEDFARFHPGGSLGKQLYLRVDDIYGRNERPAVKVDDHIRQVILEMTSKRLGATAVVSENEELIGVITDGDLRRMLESHADVSHLRAKDIMTRNPVVVQKNQLAVEALNRLREKSISQIVVCEDKKYLGFVHLHDLVNEGIL